MQQLSDEELVARYRAEGGPWIDELFGRYHRRVAMWCYRFTGDRDSAADLAQDVFLRAYRSLEGFRGNSSRVVEPARPIERLAAIQPRMDHQGTITAFGRKTQRVAERGDRGGKIS